MDNTPTEKNYSEETQKLETNLATIASSPISHKNKPAHHYFVFACGTIALLLLGFIGGQNFERTRIQHFSGWSNNYERNFFDNQLPMPPKGMPRGIPPESFHSYAILGKILTVGENKISVQDEKTNQEQAIIIIESTTMRNNNSNININDLKPDQRVAIFGRPDNSGQITASLIRILESEKSAVSPDNRI